MHILIYDPIHTGHHLNWVRLAIEAFEPHASRITFATTEQAFQSSEFNQHLARLRGRFQVDAQVAPIITGPDRMFEGFRVARRSYQGLVEAIRRNRPDHVFVSHIDALLRAPLTMRPSSLKLDIDPQHVEGVIIEAPYAWRRDLPFRRQLRMASDLYGLSQLPFGRISILTPLAVNWLQQHMPSLARRCNELPDAVNPAKVRDKSIARRSLGLPLDGRLIGCVGVLDVRKGVDEFVKSFAAAPLKPNDRLLLAGRASAEVHIAVAAARKAIGPDHIIMLDRTLTNDELDMAVAAVDVLSITYRFPDHVGMSSMLIRATAAGRPVLSMSKGWPGYITRELSLGWIYPENAYFRPRAIHESLERSASFTLSERAHQFAGFHSEEHLREIFAARVSSSGPRTTKRAA
jgi:glycosyltransferase involved in cell wall biosynthesis